ncbi:hypothetical protein NHX12_003265 [Muraenolepis orangiensis]|uniref:Uncharacterized protein n=1 Tax=Muraenolepis orangiensis TaxID=630683 RepID=A0A9Q0DXQ3_9TELE|nr:hypothetical protein NHX12_003265 [Muraenolepis orangiensis]
MLQELLKFHRHGGIGLKQRLAVYVAAVIGGIPPPPPRRDSPSTSHRPPGDRLLAGGTNRSRYQTVAGQRLSFNNL